MTEEMEQHWDLDLKSNWSYQKWNIYNIGGRAGKIVKIRWKISDNRHQHVSYQKLPSFQPSKTTFLRGNSVKDGVDEIG